MFICMFKREGLHYIYSDEKGCIHAFETFKRGNDYFTEDYVDRHKRGATWSTGATLHWLAYQPRIIEIETVKNLEDGVLQLPNAKVFTVSDNMFGRMTGIRCDGPGAQDLYELGKTVGLVEERQ